MVAETQQLDKSIESILPVKKGVRQGEAIQPKLFTATLEYLFKNWIGKSKEFELMVNMSVT